MKFLKWLNFGEERHYHKHLVKRKNKNDFIDLSELYHLKEEQEERENNKEPKIEYIQPSKEHEEEHERTAMSMLGKSNSRGESETIDLSGENSIEEKRRRLAKRIADLTTGIEDLSSKLYLLTQRIEVLEKKTKVNDYS